LTTSVVFFLYSLTKLANNSILQRSFNQENPMTSTDLLPEIKIPEHMQEMHREYNRMVRERSELFIVHTGMRIYWRNMRTVALIGVPAALAATAIVYWAYAFSPEFILMTIIFLVMAAFPIVGEYRKYLPQKREAQRLESKQVAEKRDAVLSSPRIKLNWCVYERADHVNRMRLYDDVAKNIGTTPMSEDTKAKLQRMRSEVMDELEEMEEFLTALDGVRGEFAPQTPVQARMYQYISLEVPEFLASCTL
jgi:hypothetical protein